jgi:hypothetical protein
VRASNCGQARLSSGTLKASKRRFNGAASVVKMLLVYDGAASLTNSNAKQIRLFDSRSFGTFTRPETGSERSTPVKELTKKYENLQLKYESLEDLGKNDAETNFEKLKRASDQKAKDANELISSLKKELSDVRKSSSAVTSETSGLQKQVSSLTASNDKITTERDELKEKLKVSQNEIKSMEAKLIAARQQLSSSVLEAKAQVTAASKLNSSSTAGLGDAHKEAKMKENLYADLTGLIVCGVKRMDGEDVYDCIQTGRNGSKSTCLICLHECASILTSFQHYTFTSPSRMIPQRHIPRHRQALTTQRLNLPTSLCWTRAEIGNCSICFQIT